MAPLADAASIRSTIADLIEREEDAFLARQPRSADDGRAGPALARRRGDVELDDRPAGHGVVEPRPGLEGLRRRRHRVRRPPRRLRRDAGRPRPSRRSSRPCSGGWSSARTSPSRPRTPSSWPRSSAQRFGLPLWRFGNSGTEATMDAVHLMRAVTGRDLIIKIEGSYHGHHDSVMVSMYNHVDELGPRERPHSVRRRQRASRRPSSTSSPSCRSTTSTCSTAVLDRARRPRRRHDHGADDDERRHRPARARLPRGRAPAHPATTACCWPSTRSRPASRSAPAG